MTQNDVNIIQDALGVKCAQLMEEIVANNNFVHNARKQQAEKPKETKKKESN